MPTAKLILLDGPELSLVHSHVTHLGYANAGNVRRLHEQKDPELFKYFHDGPSKFYSAIGAIESFLGYHPDADAFDVAAAYGFHIGKAHAWHDGNKRTAYMTTVVFLDINGCEIRVNRLVDTEKCIVKMVKGRLTREAFASRLRKAAKS